MDDTDDSLRGRIDDHDGSDFFLFHEVEGFASKKMRADGLRGPYHTIASGHGKCCAAVLFHQAAEVAIREDAGELAVGGEDSGHAEFFGRHFMECGRHGRIGGYLWHGVAGVHEVFDAKKFLAEATGRVKSGEIVRLEAAAFEKRNGEGIAQSHGDRSAGGGSEVEGAGFFFDADIENNVAGAPKSGFGIASERDDRHFETLQSFEEIQDFLGFAAVGDGEESVAASKHTEVAVERFGRMKEEGRCAGAGKSGGHFAADKTRLAHASDHHAALAGKQKVDGAVKRGVESRQEILERLGLDAEDATGSVEAHSGVIRDS